MHLYLLLPNFPVSRFAVHCRWRRVNEPVCLRTKLDSLDLWFQDRDHAQKHCQGTLTSWNVIMELNRVYPKIRIRGLIKIATELSHTTNTENVGFFFSNRKFHKFSL